MQATPHVADPPDELTLDERVHVFIRPIDKARILPAAFEDVAETVADRRRVGRRQHAGPRQRFRPGQTALDVVLEQAAVEGKRGLPLEDIGVWGVGEPT